MGGGLQRALASSSSAFAVARNIAGLERQLPAPSHAGRRLRLGRANLHAIDRLRSRMPAWNGAAPLSLMCHVSCHCQLRLRGGFRADGGHRARSGGRLLQL
jgi:hypothetical protein